MRRMISEKEFNIIKEAKRLLENIVVSEDGTKVEIGGNVEIDGYVDATQVGFFGLENIGTQSRLHTELLNHQKCIELLDKTEVGTLVKVYYEATEFHATGFNVTSGYVLNNGDVYITKEVVADQNKNYVIYKIDDVIYKGEIIEDTKLYSYGGEIEREVFDEAVYRTFTPLLETSTFRGIQNAINGENTITITVTDDDWDAEEELYVKHVNINNVFIVIDRTQATHTDASISLFNLYFKGINGSEDIEGFEGGAAEEEYRKINISSTFDYLLRYIAVFNGIVSTPLNTI